MKKRILVRLPNWLGDLVMSSAFTSALAQVEPNATIEGVVKENLLPLASRLPGISEVHAFSKKRFPGLRGLYRYGRYLSRTGPIDHFFCLPDSFSSAWMAFWSRATKRTGYQKEMRNLLLTEALTKPSGLHRAEEYLGLLKSCATAPLPALRVKVLTQGLPPLKAPLQEQAYFVLNFNSEASSRRMPVEKARALLVHLADTFPETTQVLIGGPGEAGFVGHILEGISRRNKLLNLAGSTTLPELMAVLSKAKAMISTDSGPAHLANALGTPMVVLFGAGNENNTGPYNREVAQVLRVSELPCAPCLKNTCRFGLPKCLMQIEESRISRVLQQVISASE